MRIKLKDVKYGEPYEETFGTCELCMYSSETRDEILVFESDSGETTEISNYWWSWGDRFEYFDVENWAEFAQWLGSKEWDITDEDFSKHFYNVVESISYEWKLHEIG